MSVFANLARTELKCEKSFSLYSFFYLSGHGLLGPLLSLIIIADAEGSVQHT